MHRPGFAASRPRAAFLAALFAASLPVLAVVAPGTLAPPCLRAQMPTHHESAAVPSTTLAVQTGTQTQTFTAAELSALPQVTLSLVNAHTHQTEVYTGPLLADVLAKAGLALSPSTQHRLLDSYLVATGTDGYFVLYAGAEVEPGLNHSQVVVALTLAGQPLTRAGAFQLVDAEDVKPARWVRNLSRIEVVQVQSTGGPSTPDLSRPSQSPAR